MTHWPKRSTNSRMLAKDLPIGALFRVGFHAGPQSCPCLFRCVGYGPSSIHVERLFTCPGPCLVDILSEFNARGNWLPGFAYVVYDPLAQALYEL